MPLFDPKTQGLESLVIATSFDPGLKAATKAGQITSGLSAARKMNDVLTSMLELTGANNDGVIRPGEIRKISGLMKEDAERYLKFMEGHGDDEGKLETGYHLVKENGGNLIFQGRNMIDNVIDGIYHFGFDIKGARFVNEDGNTNEKVTDIAGWLNFFLNGRTYVFGGGGNDQLGSGKYSKQLAKAANETFEAGSGDDKIWADVGNDIVRAGAGNDISGGGTGNDKLYGEAGNDKLYGDSGNDLIDGGDGNDEIGGGKGNNTMSGGAGRDNMWGDVGNDVMSGGSGNDMLGGGDGRNTMSGGTGNDTMSGGKNSDVIAGDGGNDTITGGSGNDKLSGGDGADVITGGEGQDWISGGAGADKLLLWNGKATLDKLIFKAGDSGISAGTVDLVDGFVHGEDVIDLTALGSLSFTTIDFIGDSQGSVFFDGHFLRIDIDGDRAVDMMIEFSWVQEMTAGDLLLA